MKYYSGTVSAQCLGMGRGSKIVVVVIGVLFPAGTTAQSFVTWEDPVADEHGIRFGNADAAHHRMKVAEIDLCAGGIEVRVTSPSEAPSTPTQVEDFGTRLGAVLAVSGTYVQPSSGHNPDFVVRGSRETHPGANRLGGSIAFGEGITTGFLSSFLAAADNGARITSFNERIEDYSEIMSGHPVLVQDGVDGRTLGGFPGGGDSTNTCAPGYKNAIGINREGTKLYFATSKAAVVTCNGLAELMFDLGAHWAVQLDGSTVARMWRRGHGIVSQSSSRSDRSSSIAVIANGPSQPPAHCTCDAGSSVERIYGESRFETAAQVARRFFDGTSDHVVVTSGSDLDPDALAAGPLAGALKAPLLFAAATQGALPQATVDALQWLRGQGVHKATVIGGSAVIPDAVLERLGDMGFDVNRISGSDRFTTAIAVAREIRAQFEGNGVALANGQNPIDALGGGPLMAHRREPILYVDAGTVPDATAAYLSEISADGKLDTVHILGGTAAVNENVEAFMSTYAHQIERIAGSNRYATSTEIVTYGLTQQTYASPNEFMVANADTGSADALAAGWIGRPIILSSGDRLASSSWLALSTNLPGKIYLLGGQSVVLPRVESQSCAALARFEEPETRSYFVAAERGPQAQPIHCRAGRGGVYGAQLVFCVLGVVAWLRTRNRERGA